MLCVAMFLITNMKLCKKITNKCLHLQTVVEKKTVQLFSFALSKVIPTFQQKRMKHIWFSWSEIDFISDLFQT